MANRIPLSILETVIFFSIVACTLAPKTTPRPSLPANIFTPPTPLILPTAPDSLYTDASFILNGVCFNALLPLAGNSFMLNTQLELEDFYTRLNVAGVCRTAFTPPQVDFSHQAVIGIVILTRGCTAALIPQSFTIGQVVQVILKLEVDPTCDYELLVSFVVAIERPPPGSMLSIQVT